MINAVKTSNTFYTTAKQNLIQVYNKSLKYHLLYSDRLGEVRVSDISVWKLFWKPIAFYYWII